MNMENIFDIVSSRTTRELINAIVETPDCLSTTDSKGITLLHKAAAAFGDKSEMVLVLLRNGADPNAKDKDGWTPLDWADLFVNRDVIEILLPLTTKDPN